MKPDFKVTLKVTTKLELESNFLNASRFIHLNFKIKFGFENGIKNDFRK